MLLITGSGAQDRDETLAGHRPFLLLADTLTRSGYAVLRLDDRGVGGSTGDLQSSSYQDLTADESTKMLTELSNLFLGQQTPEGFVAAMAG